MKKSSLQLWEEATNELVEQFIQEYIVTKEYPREKIYWYWIVDQVGGTVSIGDDWFYELETIVKSLRYKISRENLEEWDSINFMIFEANHEDGAIERPLLTLESFLESKNTTVKNKPEHIILPLTT